MVDVRSRCVDLPVPGPFTVPRPETREAAVLVPVFAERGEARLVLTKRPEHLPSHRGEIAFPGGKVDLSVDAGPRDAALREAEEEVGLPRAAVDVVGELETLGTVAGAFVITPFVGIVERRPALVAAPGEVERILDVSLAELLDHGVHRTEVWDFAGAERSMHFFELEDETVWGATARILAGFLAHLTGLALPAR